MLYGRQDPAEIEMPKCPCCQSETNDLYESEDGDILGCPTCLYPVPEDAIEFDAWEWWRELLENEYIEHLEMMRYEM